MAGRSARGWGASWPASTAQRRTPSSTASSGLHPHPKQGGGGAMTDPQVKLLGANHLGGRQEGGRPVPRLRLRMDGRDELELHELV